jgi:Uma2 family endonuclease
MVEQTHIQMTAAEFQVLPESSEHIELIHGELVVSPTPRHRHQNVIGNLHLMLAGLIPSGKIVLSPMDVYLSDTDVVQPDVFWVSGPESRCKLGTDDYWHGAPDLIIEVLSPGTALRDKTVKFELYEKHDVCEYWLVDPDALYIEVWRLDESKFMRVGVFGPSDKFESTVLGQTIETATVFK